MTKKILSIDGGGIRGILPARFVEALEAKLGRPAREAFDLVAGTSTGGIIAVGLAHGIEAKALAEFYHVRGPDIFPPGGVLSKARALAGPVYDAAPLEAALKDVLGDAWLSEIAAPELIVPAYAVSVPDNWFFRSWKARRSGQHDYKLRDVARATSAAPFYFSAAHVTSRGGDHGAMIDGGVFANNPAAVAASAAWELWPDEQLLIVSIGTGTHVEPIDLGNGSALDVAPKIVDVFMDSGATLVDRLMNDANAVAYRRFEIDVSTPVGGAGQTASEAMDDASAGNLALLDLLARKLVASADLSALARELTT